MMLDELGSLLNSSRTKQPRIERGSHELRRVLPGKKFKEITDRSLEDSAIRQQIAYSAYSAYHQGESETVTEYMNKLSELSVEVDDDKVNNSKVFAIKFDVELTNEFKKLLNTLSSNTRFDVEQKALFIDRNRRSEQRRSVEKRAHNLERRFIADFRASNKSFSIESAVNDKGQSSHERKKNENSQYVPLDEVRRRSQAKLCVKCDRAEHRSNDCSIE